MAELSEKDASGSTKLVGSDASGNENNFANVTAQGGLHANLRDNSGAELGTADNPIYTNSNAEILSPLPQAVFENLISINAGITTYEEFTATQRLALKQFYAGGTGIGKQAVYSYLPSTTQLVPFGNFESSGDVSNWIYTTNGGTGVLAFSTAQQFTNSGSMSLTFTTSDTNHLNGAKQTFSTPQDYSTWRYITAEFYNTVSTGGAYTRNIAIILTDSGGSTRTYLVSGLSTASPFNTSGWVQILGEIANPTSSTGTAFDTTSIASLELRQWDSANKSGTVYWDAVRLQGQLDIIFPIYHLANTSFSINIDPVFIMEIGDKILIAQTNNDSSRKEYYALASGVSI